ncbi:hypothetical protein IKG07_00270 [Candidatus Saccharibacteria bacterium]|nr:hypothetical protein [Candidatus Saccharibacteria bacterium]
MLTRLVRNLFLCVCIVFACSFLLLGSLSNASAADVDYIVNVAPSLNITLSSNNVVLNLNPNTKTSDSKDLNIKVSTNNMTGYQLTMSSSNDATDLVRDNTADGKNATIPTLSAEAGATASSLTDNTWGYKKDSGNFIPYVSGVKLLENNVATNEDTTTLSFASKINYSQAAGTYTIGLNLAATTNPTIPHIQNITPEICQREASTADYTVMDLRDSQEYTVRWINGTCWMTQNLRFIGKADDPAGTMTLNSETSNVESSYTTTNPLSISYTDLSTGGSSLTAAKMHYDGSGTKGALYNYALASAMTITGTSNSVDAAYDICPAGWRLPTHTEQESVVAYTTEYNMALEGYYYGNGTFSAGVGVWSSSTPYNATYRWYLSASDTSTLTPYYANVTSGGRSAGLSIRCVAKTPRTLDDITNMQEMDRDIVTNTTGGATKTLIDTRDNREYTVKKIGNDLWMIKNLAIGCNAAGTAPAATALNASTSNIASSASFSTPTALLSTAANSGSSSGFTTAAMQCNPTIGAWYNYAAATANTITGSSNTNTDVYNICPKGWTLPSYAQIEGLVDGHLSEFNPLPVNGYYSSGNIISTADAGWWSATPATYSNNTTQYRYLIYYLGSTSNFHFPSRDVRYLGYNIRCVAR